MYYFPTERPCLDGFGGPRSINENSADMCLSSVGLPEVVIEKDLVAMAASNLRPCFWNGDFIHILPRVLETLREWEGQIALPQ